MQDVIMHAQYERLDIPFMGCHFFANVTQGEDWEAPDHFVGDYLLSDVTTAQDFCKCVHIYGLDFALSEYNPHKMTDSDWEQYDSMILAILAH